MTDFNMPGFNWALFLLLIFLGIWIASAIGGVKLWPGLIRFFGEIMIGLLLGGLLGYALSFHRYTGILTVLSLTIGTVLFFKADSNNKIQRLLAVLLAFACAGLVYYSEWGDFHYLLDAILEDFHGSS